MTGYETTLDQAAEQVEFMIDGRGRTKGVFLPLVTWQAVLEALEDAQDLAVAKEYLTRRTRARSPEEMGFLRWQDVATEWDHD